MSGEAGFVLHGVSKRFGRNEALRRLSIEIPRGTALGLLGPNGAGKTTAVKLLMGLLRPDAGDIRVDGLNPWTDALGVKSRVGYVPEQQYFHRWMRVDQILSFCRTFYPTWNDDLASDLILLLEIDPRAKAASLSKGTLVKLALTVALAHEPELLILDEPMAGLDPMAREELLSGLLRSLSDRPRTMIFSSHTLGDVQRMADQIAILDRGELIVHAPVDQLLRGTKRLRVVLPDRQTPTVAPPNVVWQNVDDRQWLLTVRDFSSETVQQLRARNKVDAVDVVDLGLEDIFKDYVRGRRVSA
ncbi:MAG: ABC transporter ATP-binding protein [Planctomycetota bacterium]